MELVSLLAACLSLFIDAISNSGYTASNDWVIMDYELESLS
jgi:hypothetical protein